MQIISSQRPILWVAAAALLLAAAAASATRPRTRRQQPATPEDITTTTTPTPTTTSRKPNERPAAINYTLVDQLFREPVQDVDELAQRWRKMDKTLTDGMRAILKVVFPQAVSMASDAKVSGACSGAILKWILNLRNLRTWAIAMLDSIGKPSAGLLEGSLTMFGNYRQCLQIRAPDEEEIEATDEFHEYFRGKYCVLELRPPLARKPQFYALNSTIPALLKSHKYYEKSIYDDLSELAMAFNFVSIRADLCVPSLCSRDDIQRVADYLAKKVDMRARVARCDTEPIEGAPENSFWSVYRQHLIRLLPFAVLLLLVIGSTCISLLFRYQQRANKKSRSSSILTSMSVYKSIGHIRNVHLDTMNQVKPVSLYGLRVLVLMWVFLSSIIGQLQFQFLRELLPLRDLILLWPMQLLVNNTFAYETFIILTAFTFSYHQIQSNLSDLAKYMLSKYARLMPSIMLFVSLTILMPQLYQNRSPLWHDFVDEPAQVCQSTGLFNLFFLQNFLQADKICLPHTWLFCVEFQLCLLSIPIVCMLNRQFDRNHGHFKADDLANCLLALVAALGCLLNFANIHTNQLPGVWLQTYPDKEDANTFFSLHQYKTWSHLTSFAVGLYAGHLCRCLTANLLLKQQRAILATDQQPAHDDTTMVGRRHRRQRLYGFSGHPYGRRCCDNLIWAFSLVAMAAVLFSTYSWSTSGQLAHVESPLLCAIYGALAPLFWSLAVSLLLVHFIVPNEKNQLSALATLLATDINLVRLGRVSFLAYLINPIVNRFIFAIQEQPIFSSIIMLAHTFLGNLIITFILAFVVSVLVELPCRRLCKKLLIGSSRKCTNFDIISHQFSAAPYDHNHHHHHFSQQQQHLAANLGPAAASHMIPLK